MIYLSSPFSHGNIRFIRNGSYFISSDCGFSPSHQLVIPRCSWTRELSHDSCVLLDCPHHTVSLWNVVRDFQLVSYHVTAACKSNCGFSAHKNLAVCSRHWVYNTTCLNADLVLRLFALDCGDHLRVADIRLGTNATLSTRTLNRYNQKFEVVAGWVYFKQWCASGARVSRVQMASKLGGQCPIKQAIRSNHSVFHLRGLLRAIEVLPVTPCRTNRTLVDVLGLWRCSPMKHLVLACCSCWYKRMMLVRTGACSTWWQKPNIVHCCCCGVPWKRHVR